MVVVPRIDCILRLLWMADGTGDRLTRRRVAAAAAAAAPSDKVQRNQVVQRLHVGTAGDGVGVGVGSCDADAAAGDDGGGWSAEASEQQLQKAVKEVPVLRMGPS